MSPTALSLRLLRSWPGFRVEVVERWSIIPGRKIRRDCFGGFDLLAVDVKGKATWLIQTTSLSNLSSRVKKLRGLPVVGELIRAGIVCEAWGWAQREQGGRWHVRRVRLQAGALEPLDVLQRPRRGGKRHVQASLFD